MTRDTTILGSYNHQHRYVGVAKLDFPDAVTAHTPEAATIADRVAKHVATIDPEDQTPLSGTMLKPEDVNFGRWLETNGMGGAVTEIAIWAPGQPFEWRNTRDGVSH